MSKGKKKVHVLLVEFHPRRGLLHTNIHAHNSEASEERDLASSEEDANITYRFLTVNVKKKL